MSTHNADSEVGRDPRCGCPADHLHARDCAYWPLIAASGKS